MRAGIAPGFDSALAFGLLLAACAPVSFAADTDTGCQTYVDAQWKPAQATSMSSCLLQIESATTVYDAQGFKFGLWGTTLLSADVTYFYSSMDSGASWQVVGQKAAITPDIDSSTGPTLAAKPAPEPVQTTSALSRITDFFVAAGDPPTAPQADAEVLMPQPATVSQAPQGGERHSCNMRLGSHWEVVKNQTLQQCIALFDRSPDQFDANGFKYGYWSGTYLTANRQEVLQSTNSRDWTTVLMR